MSTLATYRSLVPAHATVQDSIIETWLELAAQAHTAARWGAVYAAAMVMWAAAHIEPLVVAGDVGDSHDQCDNPLPAVMVVQGATPAKVVIPEVEKTMYWSLYLRYRDSRAATKPKHVLPWL